MSDYTAIDRETLKEELTNITDVLESVDLTEKQKEEIGSSLTKINNTLHSISQPIHIEDRPDGFEIVVTE